MHQGIANMPIPGGQQVRLSAGIAELRHGETAAGLFERADAALRRSKDQGKDRATTASE
jgi:PleD family two-component response regulator